MGAPVNWIASHIVVFFILHQIALDLSEMKNSLAILKTSLHNL
ncbi:hypothetical protein MCAMS1_00605 [biofilm metagenome]